MTKILKNKFYRQMKYFLRLIFIKMQKFRQIFEKFNNINQIFSNAAIKFMKSFFLSFKIIVKNIENYFKGNESLLTIIKFNNERKIKFSFEKVRIYTNRNKIFATFMKNMEKFTISLHKQNFFKNLENIEKIKKITLIYRSIEIYIKKEYLIYAFYEKEKQEVRLESENVTSFSIQAPEFTNIKELKKIIQLFFQNVRKFKF